MSWQLFQNGKTLGEHGSEQGTLICDEEHIGGARITLEQDVGGGLFAITSGLYGWMVHTRFFSAEQEGRSAFQAMRAALADLVNRQTTIDDDGSGMIAAISSFMERFP